MQDWSSTALRVTARTLLLIGGVAGAGCDGPGITDPSPTVDVRPYVTGAAAAALGADGLFTFPVPSAPATEPIITAERARELAQAFVSSFGPLYKQQWEQESGRSIDLAGLRPDPRVFYASTPYELFPEGYHPAFARAFGPYYLVRMSSGSETPLIIAVAAYNKEIAIDADGLLDLPPNHGMEFIFQALPANPNRRSVIAPLLPEAAVVLVARLTGARISERPEYVLRAPQAGPLGGVWKLTLEHPVRVRTVAGGRTVEVREIYVGRLRGSQLFIPAAEQPQEHVTSAFRIPPAGKEPHWETIRLAVRPGQPTLFEEVVVT